MFESSEVMTYAMPPLISPIEKYLAMFGSKM
jgi:hypothetical protein